MRSKLFPLFVIAAAACVVALGGGSAPKPAACASGVLCEAPTVSIAPLD